MPPKYDAKNLGTWIIGLMSNANQPTLTLA